ncbi:hypothetical protein Corgl_1629 [Coriobacterium glomerans PW2]|uniref:Phospholipase C/D domain-containing protein n=1 Tax=Coriobacterium glomerans (strain ATCC 49209 / DSM 20642 / JCM 10262 / PW2) TaxID=700015 RepID=F2N952_CORGP|nr:zinc dependent phospholipase C family protein [Coriobacterium glomerans]AEB07728.1 hypothetical protein Corgl_1629 [Coriobacterium glomerans PW2]
MPALITHRLFGEESIDLLPEGTVVSEDERRAFLIANQGPDPFFFRFRSLHMRECAHLGTTMHASQVTRQLEVIREGVDHLRDDENRTGRAFALGMLSHYILDRTAHPFVYAEQHAIQDADDSLAALEHQVHAIIESDLDVLMLQLKRTGAPTDGLSPSGALETCEAADRVGGALLSYAAHRVYGIEIGGNEYAGAVRDMALVYRIIEPAGSGGERLVGAVESLHGGYSLLASLAHRMSEKPAAGTGNMDHLSWRNPFTEADSCESFPDVFDRALEDCADAMSAFIDGADMKTITGHLNYSGEPLGEPQRSSEGSERSDAGQTRAQ